MGRHRPGERTGSHQDQTAQRSRGVRRTVRRIRARRHRSSERMPVDRTGDGRVRALESPEPGISAPRPRARTQRGHSSRTGGTCRLRSAHCCVHLGLAHRHSRRRVGSAGGTGMDRRTGIRPRRVCSWNDVCIPRRRPCREVVPTQVRAGFGTGPPQPRRRTRGRLQTATATRRGLVDGLGDRACRRPRAAQCRSACQNYRVSSTPIWTNRTNPLSQACSAG